MTIPLAPFPRKVVTVVRGLRPLHALTVLPWDVPAEEP